MLPDDQPTVPTAPPNGSRSVQGSVWVAPSVEELQEKLPQYEVLEILGRGGMGAVYKARQKSLKRLVAIKILPLVMADDEMKFAERFQNEAQTMAQMNHPAIVGVHDFGETSDGLLYFVMEFVDGTDVQKMIQASVRLSGEYALAITAHVCDALSYAHKRGVIHRDIKPANILIDQEGHIKVADFGLAKMSDPSMTSGLTKTNMAMGTPDYVAPEVLVTGMVADHRADIYAVGVMLYQMLTGEVPRGMFKLPSHKGLGSDPRFDAIICKAMEQDRDERYQSAMDMRRALDVILTTPQATDDGTGVVSASQIPQKPVAKQPRPPGEKSVPPQPAAQQQAARKPAPVKKSPPATTWLSIGGIAIVLGVAAFFILGGKPKPGSAESASADSSVSSQSAQPPIKVRENPPAPQMTASAATNGKTIDWLKATPPEVKPWTAELGGLKEGVLTPTSKFTRMLGTLKDGSVRVRVRRAPGSEASKNPMLAVEIRNGAMPDKTTGFGQYQFQVFVPKRTCSFNFEEKEKAGIPGKIENLWKSNLAIEDDSSSDGIEWEFRAAGDEFSAWADGKLIQSARDPRVPTGICTIHFDAGMQITRLETTGVTPIKSSTSPKPVADALPNITNWQDVTEKTREQARTTSGLRVENDGTILQTADGRFPKLTLTSPGIRDYAVRLRFTGEAQVAVRSQESGYLGVKSEANQSILLRYYSQERRSEKISATKTHPLGFDPSKEHELMVIMGGNQLRAWMDGVFLGDAYDDNMNEGSAELLFVTQTAVKKVEIAELATDRVVPPPMPPQIFNGHRYLYVPGEFKWMEAKEEAEKRGGHLATITSAEENDWAWQTFSVQLPPQPKETRWKRGWWLGASQSEAEEPWQWLIVEPMSYLNWGGGEPKAAINPPRYVWMIADGNTPANAIWTVQTGANRGGFLVEWDSEK